MDWQRNYAAVARLLTLGAEPADIVPGVTAGGVDVGRWLQRQRQHVVWEGLAPGQRERLTALGITPLPSERKTPAKPSRGGSTAFERGCAALKTQYKARTGTTGPVSRSHTETLPDGTEVRLGVFLSNTKTRRTKLSAEQLERLASLGLDWVRRDADARPGDVPRAGIVLKLYLLTRLSLHHCCPATRDPARPGFVSLVVQRLILGCARSPLLELIGLQRVLRHVHFGALLQQRECETVQQAAYSTSLAVGRSSAPVPIDLACAAKLAAFSGREVVWKCGSFDVGGDLFGQDSLRAKLLHEQVERLGVGDGPLNVAAELGLVDRREAEGTIWLAFVSDKRQVVASGIAFALLPQTAAEAHTNGGLVDAPADDVDVLVFLRDDELLQALAFFTGDVGDEKYQECLFVDVLVVLDRNEREPCDLHAGGLQSFYLLELQSVGVHEWLRVIGVRVTVAGHQPGCALSRKGLPSGGRSGLELTFEIILQIARYPQLQLHASQLPSGVGGGRRRKLFRADLPLRTQEMKRKISHVHYCPSRH
ncbi:helicase associated domain-containing protein [Streptomyces shenzhenensis]|uniref:helicase associated domain-containing protein n=1 Tax=Streptomyces shenzhenensis TaxID=943815 RepID=UPI0033EFB2C8